MKIVIYYYGKPNEPYIQPGVAIFTARIKHYYSIDWVLLPPTKQVVVTTNYTAYTLAEAGILLPKLLIHDYIIALDERGTMLSSPALGQHITKAALASSKRMVYIIGGAYGIHQSVLNKCNLVWSLSALVFPHQLVRLILTEQLYRACTINNNEQYHH